MKTIYTNVEDKNYEMLELLSSIKGINKNHIINEALGYYFNAIKTIPEEFMLKPIYVDEKEFKRLEKEAQPTEALKRLLNNT